MSSSLKGSLQVQVTVPTYFLCPISLELMRDPVTLSSGQTFDRCSIQQWLDDGHNTCPVTRQPLADSDLDNPIPNHALRRMIQSWCVQNQSCGIERILTPRQPPSLKDIPSLLDLLAPNRSSSSSADAAHASLDALQKLSRLAMDRPRARHAALSSGALPVLSKLLTRSFPGSAPISTTVSAPMFLTVVDEVLKLLDCLIVPDALADYDLQQLHTHEELTLSLANALLRSAASDSRARASSILLRLQPCECLRRKLGEMQGFVAALVDLIREDDVCAKASLELLVDVCAASSKNRIRATEAGAVGVLSRLLESSRQSNFTDRAIAELVLRGLEILCQCAEGRAAVVASPSTLTIIVKHMTAVSERAAHHAVHIISLVVKWAPEADEVKASAFHDGALVKTIAVAQSATASETRLAARKLAASLSEASTQNNLSLSRTLRIL